MKMYGASYGFGSGSVFTWDGICRGGVQMEVVEFHRSPNATSVSYTKVKKRYPSVYQSPGRKKWGEHSSSGEKCWNTVFGDGIFRLPIVLH